MTDSNNTDTKRRVATWFVSLIALAFGALTLKSGGQVLFGAQEHVDAAGNYVPFVLWFNFIAGFFYLLAGLALFLRHESGKPLAILIALSTAFAFGALGIYILNGGAFEVRTVVAMTLRTLIWTGIAVFAWWFTPGRSDWARPA